MRRTGAALILATLGASLGWASGVRGAEQGANSEPQGAFKDWNTQRSYAIGAQTARNLRKDAAGVDVKMLIRGLRDGFGDGALLMSDKELQAVMSRVQQDLRRNMVLNRRAEADRNREQGTKFLAAHATQAGVVTTASGLQYRIVAGGKGAKPLMSSVVRANYRGTLTDGSEFESSPAGQPARLVVAQTITGLREALLMMNVGSKWQLVLPSRLGYGDRGAGTTVGPNQVLQFEVELTGIDQGIDQSKGSP